MIRLSISPRFGGEATLVVLDGPDEGDLANLLVARAQAADSEVWVEDEEGELVNWEEMEHG